MTTVNPPDVNEILNDRTVLIIEDDPIMLRALGHAFQRAGCQIVGARDGEEGLARFLERTPDLVITDILMPKREGVETILAMKARAPHVKILAISGGGRLGAEEILGLAAGLGADAILPKPFRSTEILAAARRLLEPDGERPDPEA
jgi:DNA-binding response OmpR family regulator